METKEDITIQIKTFSHNKPEDLDMALMRFKIRHPKAEVLTITHTMLDVTIKDLVNNIKHKHITYSTTLHYKDRTPPKTRKKTLK